MKEEDFLRDMNIYEYLKGYCTKEIPWSVSIISYEASLITFWTDLVLWIKSLY